MDDAVMLAGISVACVLLKKVRKRKRKPRSMWMSEYLKKRNYGILNDLELNENMLFKNFTRMSRENVYTLLHIVRPKIEKNNTYFRDAVPPQIRLAICLRYLATGDSFTSLMYLFRVSKQVISSMLPEVLTAIIEGLREFVKVPADSNEWKRVAYDFNNRWNYPHCIGAIDGKHIQILRPENTVSDFYNYKGTHSIVLMAIADAHYNFLYVNVGCQGRISDGGVFKYTTFHRKLISNDLGIPEEEPLLGRSEPVPYVLLADDAFPLTDNIMKPYVTDLQRGSPERNYNYRHSRGRVVVENAFGVMSAVFRIFRKPIEVKVESTVVDIVLACVYLHNFLRSQPDGCRHYAPPGTFERENLVTGEVVPGSWRSVTSGDTGMRPLPSFPRNMAQRAKAVRSEFKNYFLTEFGSIPK